MIANMTNYTDGKELALDSAIKNNTTLESKHFQLDSGNEGFMVFTTTLLWMLIAGCGFFYGGMARSKSALSMMTLSLWSIAIVSVQWFIVGYSLAFSTTSRNAFIGDFAKVFYIGVGETPYPTADGITEISFCFYQGITAAIPASLISGALAERARVLPALVFIVLWNTLVYSPCIYWSQNPNGWGYKQGVMDFGGGAPVHVPASAAALAYSYVLGPRVTSQKLALPHNMFCLIIGTVLIWFGSFGYNSGSAFGATVQAVLSSVITNLSGSVGAITWSFLDFVKNGKCTAFGFCAGAVVGVIVIVPASGFVNPAAALPIGILGTIVCRWGHLIKMNWAFDDTLDVFAMHGLAGFVGVVLTGVFAQKAYGGDEIRGGMIDGNYTQVLTQLEDTVAGFFWSLFVSLVLLFAMNKTRLLRLRLESVDEDGQGMDINQMGVACYEHIDEIRVYVDTATWNISPGIKDKKQTAEFIISQTAVTIQSNPNHNSNNRNNELQENSNLKNANDEFVPPNSWRSYWY